MRAALISLPVLSILSRPVFLRNDRDTLHPTCKLPHSPSVGADVCIRTGVILHTARVHGDEVVVFAVKVTVIIILQIHRRPDRLRKHKPFTNDSLALLKKKLISFARCLKFLLNSCRVYRALTTPGCCLALIGQVCKYCYPEVYFSQKEKKLARLAAGVVSCLRVSRHLISRAAIFISFLKIELHRAEVTP